MTRLTDIIEIQISRETSAVAQTNFNVPAFISAHTNFVERARVYSSLLAVGDDFASTDSAYIAAQKFFGQAIKPANIVIGRRQIPGATVNVVTVLAGTTYTLTVSGTTITYVSQALDTAILIATGLKTAYDVTPVAGVTLVDNLDGTLTFTATTDWSLKVSANMSKSNAPATETWSTSVNAVQNENCLLYTSPSPRDLSTSRMPSSA